MFLNKNGYTTKRLLSSWNPTITTADAKLQHVVSRLAKRKSAKLIRNQSPLIFFLFGSLKNVNSKSLLTKARQVSPLLGHPIPCPIGLA
jgi:hypothetical protein